MAQENIFVEVKDSSNGGPVAGADISVDGLKMWVTDETGSAIVTPSMPGSSYRIGVSKTGWHSKEQTLLNGLSAVTIQLERQPGISKAVLFLAMLCVAGLGALAIVVVRRQAGGPQPTGTLTPLTSAQLSPVAFDRYQIHCQIGQGGVATIYRARDTTLGSDVALKVLDPKWMADAEMVQKFLAEAEAIRAIHKRHADASVVKLYRSGREGERIDGRPFIALELLDGESLDQRLRRLGRLPETDALGICAQIARALHCIHEVGIVHRDLTPDNIFLVNGSVQLGGRLFQAVPRAVLIDFGVARQEFLSRVTMDGSIAGKPPYMSPEQCRGLKVDSRSDLYSLGVIMFALVAGTPPFQGRNPFDVMRAHEHQEPPSLQGTASKDYAGLVHTLLAKSPEQRGASTLTVAAFLESMLLQQVATRN